MDNRIKISGISWLYLQTAVEWILGKQAREQSNGLKTLWENAPCASYIFVSDTDQRKTQFWWDLNVSMLEIVIKSAWDSVWRIVGILGEDELPWTLNGFLVIRIICSQNKRIVEGGQQVWIWVWKGGWGQINHFPFSLFVVLLNFRY